jgi:hypothetical protein
VFRVRVINNWCHPYSPVSWTTSELVASLARPPSHDAFMRAEGLLHTVTVDLVCGMTLFSPSPACV